MMECLCAHTVGAFDNIFATQPFYRALDAPARAHDTVHVFVPIAVRLPTIGIPPIFWFQKPPGRVYARMISFNPWLYQATTRKQKIHSWVRRNAALPEHWPPLGVGQ